MKVTQMCLDILNNNKITVYSIVEETRDSTELFYIKKNLDLTRSKNVTEVRLTVYHDFEREGKQYRGSSLVYVFPEQTKEEIEKNIVHAYQAAGYGENQRYELPEGKVQEVGVMPSNLAKHSLKESALAVADALYLADNRSDAFINSIEIFAEKKRVHIVTSSGCDASYIKYDINGEFVVQSLENGNDVELHQQFHYDDLNTAVLTARCEDALSMVKDRAYAQKAPQDLSAYPVILYGATVGEFLGFYKERANASMIYPKYSSYSAGYDVQKDAIGDRLELNVLPTVPYNKEGTAMKKHVLISNGIVKNIHGNAAFSSYLGVETLGSYEKVECLNHSMDFSEMTKTPYILVKSFSDFQIDELDGYFGGEFRLAYLYDGNDTKILTGGTISGNILEAQKNFKFSNERYEDADYCGPLAVKMS